jgi:hypothetical protein
MAEPDTLRTVAQEAVARVEGAPAPKDRTNHGKQVAAALRAEADRDVFTTLQIAAGEQVSPAILQANIDVAIGTIKADGSMERSVPPYSVRYARAGEAVKNIEAYFDDKLTFEAFASSSEGTRIIDNTGSFLMRHPALSEYFANIKNPTQRANAAKALARQYLQNPFAREKIREAVTGSQLNKGDVANEYSEAARKRDALAVKATALEAKIKKLEGDSTTKGEIDTMGDRRREFDRISNPGSGTPKPGKEFGLIQTRLGEIAGLNTDITAINSDLQKLQQQETNLQSERRRMQKMVDDGKVPTRDPAVIDGEIATKQGDIAGKLKDKSSKEGEKATKEAEIKAIEEDRRQLDEKINQKIEELKVLKGELSGIKNEHGEIVVKLARLEAGKGRSEELAVAELENVFKKGIEQELISRLERAKEAADKALEDSASKAKDVDEKQYKELRAKRHKDANGKVDGASINKDFDAMMKNSTEYHIVQDPANPNKVIITEMPAGGWATPPAGNEVYYLTGPEFSMLQMMNDTSEFGGKFMLGKLKDAEWMQSESQDFLAQTLQDKMYASRSWLQRRNNGVKKLSSAEITKIQNSTWGVGMLERALEQNKAHIEELERVMNGGSLKGEVLRGPGTWKEKIGRMNKSQLALLILALTAGGIMLGPVAYGLGTGAAEFLATPAAAAAITTAKVGGGLAGAGLGAAAVRSRKTY